MSNDKIVAFHRRAETAADVHWNGIHDAARNLVQLATMVNSALEPGNGRDVCKTPAVVLVWLATRKPRIIDAAWRDAEETKNLEIMLREVQL